MWGERTRTEIDWLNQAARAFQSTYGYEFQRDNVLLARVNPLMTYEEYLEDRWHRKPTQSEYQNITEIIAWNIWQMVGLTGNIPYSQTQEEYEQVSLFDDEPKEPTYPPCRIYDWREKYSVKYNRMNKGRQSGDR